MIMLFWFILTVERCTIKSPFLPAFSDSAFMVDSAVLHWGCGAAIFWEWSKLLISASAHNVLCRTSGSVRAVTAARVAKVAASAGYHRLGALAWGLVVLGTLSRDPLQHQQRQQQHRGRDGVQQQQQQQQQQQEEEVVVSCSCLVLLAVTMITSMKARQQQQQQHHHRQQQRQVVVVAAVAQQGCLGLAQRGPLHQAQATGSKEHRTLLSPFLGRRRGPDLG